MYLRGAHESYADGVEWATFRGLHFSLKDVVIKIRPKSLRPVDSNYKDFKKFKTDCLKDFKKSEFDKTPE